MWSAEVVLMCALEMLGRTASTFPPIELVAAAPPGVVATAEAYVDTGRRAIHLITSSQVFRRAQNARWRCSEVGAIRKLASILVHEEWHVRHGTSETGAYQAQLMTLLTLRADPGDGDFQAVRRAMRSVTARQKVAAREMLASAGHLVDADDATRLGHEALLNAETSDGCLEFYETPVVWTCIDHRSNQEP